MKNEKYKHLTSAQCRKIDSQLKDSIVLQEEETNLELQLNHP